MCHQNLGISEFFFINTLVNLFLNFKESDILQSLKVVHLKMLSK